MTATVRAAERDGGPVPQDAWVDVIPDRDLPVEIGVPALVCGRSVAIFRVHDGAVHAVSNLDPRTGAPVIARGIVGSRGPAPTVASPLYKDVFDLRTGRCLDDATLCLTVYQVRVCAGVVQVGGPG